MPVTSLLTIDADPMTTSANVKAVEPGMRLFLHVSLPVGREMSRTVHVWVPIVFVDEICASIFNAKEMHARIDPVVCICGLAPKGKGGCTNTSHRSNHLSFQGKRVLLSTPTVSKATTPAYFSGRNIIVDTFPHPYLLELLTDLQAPINIWRTFMAVTNEHLQAIKAMCTQRAPVLNVDMTLSVGSEEVISQLGSVDEVETKPPIPTVATSIHKGSSPMSA